MHTYNRWEMNSRLFGVVSIYLYNITVENRTYIYILLAAVGDHQGQLRVRGSS